MIALRVSGLFFEIARNSLDASAQDAEAAGEHGRRHLDDVEPASSAVGADEWKGRAELLSCFHEKAAHDE